MLNDDRHLSPHRRNFKFKSETNRSLLTGQRKPVPYAIIEETVPIPTPFVPTARTTTAACYKTNQGKLYTGFPIKSSTARIHRICRIASKPILKWIAGPLSFRRQLPSTHPLSSLVRKRVWISILRALITSHRPKRWNFQSRFTERRPRASS